jgi:Pentapeptide repeats (8 copies)
MTTNSQPVFLKNLDLRNVSFKKRNLQRANFSGSDIRGCDFSYAMLQNACFKGVKAGREPIKLFYLILVAIAVGVASFHAYSQMSFAIVSITFQDPAWIFTYPLHIILALAGLNSVYRDFSTHKNPNLQTFATAVSSTASGALLGFFYFGSTADNNLQMAIAGATIGAIVALISFFLVKKAWIKIAIASSAIIANYTLTFLFITRASANLSTHNLGKGIFWGIFCLIALVATLASLNALIEQISLCSTTSFLGADLTNANFEGARLGKTNFTNTIRS